MRNISGTVARWALCAAPVLSVLGLLAATMGQLQTPVAAQGGTAIATPPGEKLVAYSAIAEALYWFDVNVATGKLTRKGSVSLPDLVTEGVQHPSRKWMYVAYSNGFGDCPCENSGVAVFAIDPATGALTQHGTHLQMPSRVMNLSVTTDGRLLILLVPHHPSYLQVHRLNADGSIGERVMPRSHPLDMPNWPHGHAVDAKGTQVIVMGRGWSPGGTQGFKAAVGTNSPHAEVPKDPNPYGIPGSMSVFTMEDGVLINRQSIVGDGPDRQGNIMGINGGYGFQLRTAVYHATLPYAYVLQESGPLKARLYVFERKGDVFDQMPKFTLFTSVDPKSNGSTSMPWLHPNGRVLYVGNRGDQQINVYAINQSTGEPTLVQRADVHGGGPRTFAVDTAGEFLLTTNDPRNKTATREPMVQNSALHRIRPDGTLEFTDKFDYRDGEARWSALVRLPGTKSGT